MKLYPLTFEPILKERIWGGRNLETLYGKPLPSNQPIGESWEISDRPDDVSVISSGAWRGRSLRWLMEECPAALLGPRHPMPERFPLLVKIIDAQQTLSLQVHPPADVATQLSGEPKTELWYVTRADPGAEFFAGLKNGVTRAMFEEKLATQSVAECFHRILVKPGDAMFLPSGRVHALGAGTVIFEVQQNSDTTYRVFDFNRVDRDGKARQLHVPQSLASINFTDFEPELLPQSTTPVGEGIIRPLVKNEFFEVAVHTVPDGEVNLTNGRMHIIGMLAGVLHIGTARETILLCAGQFCLFPAQCCDTVARAENGALFLQVF